MKAIISATLIAVSFSGIAVAAESKSMDMSFEKCQSVQANTIAQLNVPASNIIPVVSTSSLTITRLITADGSVLISCSAPDQKMVITTPTN
jgi:hypothetical protein